MNFKKLINLKYFSILLCIFVSGCIGTFSQKQEFSSIDIEKAKWVDANIKLNVGDLFISSGDEQFMNARFDYFQPTRRPEINYDEEGEKGILSIQQSQRSSVGEFSDIDETTIELSNVVGTTLQRSSYRILLQGA